MASLQKGFIISNNAVIPKNFDAPRASKITSTGEDFTEGDLYITIAEPKHVELLAKHVLARPEWHRRIRRLYLRMEEPDSEEEGEEEDEYGGEDAGMESQAAERLDEDGKSVGSLASKNSDEQPEPGASNVPEIADDRTSQLCSHITQILDAIENAGGSLEEFAWDQQTWWGSEGTRPPAFWTALWKHARTLQTLILGFYTHEVHQVAPPQVHFPALRVLRIDCTTAHGDKGDAVEALLKSSPGLEMLEFEYPGCDLDTCQIQNITWDYNFPSLRELSVRGYDFNAEAFAGFLTRNENIEVLKDAIDGYGNDDWDKKAELPTHALPKLKKLYVSGMSPNRSLGGWFNEEASRPIAHLALDGWGAARFEEIKRGKGTLKCLEFHRGGTDWRPREIDSSDKGEDAAGDDAKVKKAAEKELNFLPKAVKELLPELAELKELGVSLEMGHISISNGHGGWCTPDPMNVDDLKTIISILPPHTQIRALRLWDDRAENLPGDVLNDFLSVPESLEYLGWEGKEKLLYRLERVGGKIRAVECEPLRVRATEGAWSEGRILDY